ncbi:THUMP domain-containing protein [Aquimarina sp. ERC-38]|uniref:THUMP domain-containing class I SAM-dependent RNA methyltransferase n=1 Tax=Aquimarina sp. ERC-38 TaxID=2949996 RepID=UPI002245DD4F|nr:THUMP domain-containing protein [Aquimarina sp. ERC-38]UZO79509.1 THUMP domain-containing protein [Aquimarina sp. ERC-38]
MTQSNEQFEMVAKTFFGFEEILANELRALGAIKISQGNRMVKFFGDTGFIYKANLCLRTALRILKPLRSGFVKNEKQLYNLVSSIDWQDYLDSSDSFRVQSTVHSETFTHSGFVNLKTKDAIADQFRDHTGVRPDVELDDPDLIIDVYIKHNTCVISLDSSGNSLHQRGYRVKTNLAPINEVLAAGLLLQAGWKGQTHFLDPMCGSGTILIEAVMIACNIPVNINRKEFAFEKWLDWDMDLYDKIEKSCLQKVRDFNHQVKGYDIDSDTLEKAQTNIKNANLSEFITLEEKDFFTSHKKEEAAVFIVFNPPYGERLKIDEETFYKQIGDTLKNKYLNSNCWFITSNLEAIKYVGLRPSRKIKMFNAKLESRLLNYKIYAGSKKKKYNQH